MKPLNLDNKPCSPISSNCVVWQGPDIPCIHLCTGDTVSDVVSALATELCNILDTLKVSNYDLTCFNLQACGPENFKELIEFLIKRICELEGIQNNTSAITESGCPDCVVSVAKCFQTGTQTTMQLVDYVQLIGERICSITEDISLINAQITDILIRVSNLENSPTPSFTLPTFTLGCTIGSLSKGTTQSIDTVLIEFINNVWCGYYAETGTTAELNAAVNQKCINDTTIQLTKPAAFSTNVNWIDDASYSTVADAINNLWVVLCEVWEYTKNNPVITVLDTPTVDLTLSSTNVLSAAVTDTGWISLNGFSHMTGVTKPACRRIGNVIHFRGQAFIPLADGSGNLIPLTSASAYEPLTGIAPYVGSGGVTLTPANQITFNGNTSVIPAGILNTGESIDEGYYLDSATILERPFTVSSRSSRLLGLSRIGLKSDGKLVVETASNFESTATGSTILEGSGTGRLITSNVTAGELIPDFTAAKSKITSFPAHTAWNASDAFSVGDVVSYSGALYQAYVNVAASGGGSNPTPSATPSVWSPYTDDLKADVTAITYPFTCDAGDRSNLGGFYFFMDGLTAFI